MQNKAKDLKVGSRVVVARYKISGYKEGVDEETGDYIRVPKFRKCGQDKGIVTKVQDESFFTVRFDVPVPNINDPKDLRAEWSVYFRDILDVIQ